MSNIAVSSKNPANRKGNKENAQPGDGVKSLIRKDFLKSTPAVSVQFKSGKKQETLVRNGASKITSQKQDAKSMSAEVLKKGKPTQKDVDGSQAHYRAILTEQKTEHGKVVTSAATTSSKFAPGMYKGKIVQSKIGSIWKSSATSREAGSEPAAPKTQTQKLANLTRSRSKSVADGPGSAPPKNAPVRSKSLQDRREQASKPAANGRLPGPRSARPLTSTSVPATLKHTSARNRTAVPTKPKIALTDKVKKPPVTSTHTQYRCTETAAERRAKLAEWQASKGKTLKRPAMTSSRPEAKTWASVNRKAGVKPESRVQAVPEPELSLGQHKPDPAASAPGQEVEELPEPVQMQSPVEVIMNTSFDLPENSHLDLPVVQDRFDDIVLNLCDVLEAMPTPSTCQNEAPQGTEVCNVAGEESVVMEDGGVKDEPKSEDAKEMEDESEKVLKSEEVQWDNNADVESVSQLDHGHVVKYNLKTTPYLQSVKKTIQDEVQQMSAARRKSNIKDLKFLTPVRRSRRIERNSSQLPPTLLDHDPCVSSLAELVMMDDLNAYVYRKNSALIEDLPDQVQA